ncbi:MAG: CPBP family intramembrane metalloprotease [Pseudoflavonifractor sp.]|nr:CPBP family intramembrane metalloprotease [Alloprevotella sp.]MCM1116019.1 CPBP family intramembrane metalloprotease [Pseudoflavonifractor sp.]
MKENITYSMGLGRRLMLFVLMALAGLSVAGMIAMALGGETSARVRIAAVAQDLVGFAIPAVAVAVMVTRRPAEMMMIHRPRMNVTLMMLGALVAAVPAMNLIVEWNASLPMPREVERAVAAQKEMITLLLGGSGAGALVMGLLIVGAMAPLTEEMLFRGCLQRLFGPMVNRHAAIWVTATVFSLAHMDPTGFIPRLLLGAFFGYAMNWSGSIWSAVMLHALNNSLAITAMWLSMRGDTMGDVIETMGTGMPLLAGGSAIVSALLLRGAYLEARRRL